VGEAAGAYVCRRDQLVRHIAVASAAAPLVVDPPLRIFGVVSSPRGLPALDVEKEKEQLERALARPVDPVRLLVKVHEEVAGLLGGPFPGGMEGDTEDADAPGRVLDNGPDVGLGAVEQVDREEVAGQDRLGLGAQEL
jgi:hypothetical protein